MQEIKKETIMSKYTAAGKLIHTMEEELWENCRVLNLKAGQKIFTGGMELSSVLIICEGAISIFEEDNMGSEMQVVILEDGCVVGEMEAITKQLAMRFSAKTVTHCTVISMSVATFLQWIKTDISICLILIELLAEKVWTVSDEVVLHVKNNAVELLCARLLRAEAGRVKLSREELAKRCGVSVRTVNRSVKKLAEEGYITIEHRKVYITKEQKAMLAQSKYLNK